MRKRKRSASDGNVPEPARSLDDVAFDDLLAWPDGVPYPNWDLLGGSDGIAQLSL